MISQTILATTIAALLCTAPSLRAVTDTWDGGGGDNNFSTGANWADNTAPVSSLASTDLIFGGTTRLTPTVVGIGFAMRSLTYNNTAGAFTMLGSTGATLYSFGDGGIVNHDAQTQTFDVLVTFGSVADSTINAAAGGLTFLKNVVMPSGTLTATGAGTVTIGSASTLAVGAAETLQLDANFTVNAGTLTRDTTGVLALAAGKTLTIQNGGSAEMTGAFTNSTASTITVTGAGSTFSSTASMFVNADSTLNVLGGGSVAITDGGNLNLGNAGGSGTLLVDGAGSNVSANQLRPGISGLTGTATFRTGAMGTFTSLQVDVSSTAGSNGVLNVESGAVITGGSLRLADQAVVNTGAITITGTNSAITITGAGTAIIGAASGSSGTLTTSGGGTFTTGTGTTTIHATGTVNTNSGTVSLLGDTTLEGQLTRGTVGTLTLAAGKTLTVQNGGAATITGTFTNATASTITVTGVGSTFSTTSTLALAGGGATNVLAGGELSSGAALSIAGTSGGHTVLVDGIGSSLGAAALNTGLNGQAGSLTFSNGSAGTFAAIGVDNSSVAGTTGTLAIQSGADVTGTALNLASNTVANTGTITIDGAGSTLTLTGAANAAIGAASLSSGTLTVQNGGAFTTGTGTTTIHATGTVNVNGGTLFLFGDTIVNGQLTRASGATLTLAAGKTLTVQNGGAATITGTFTNATASTITVTGAGSTFSTTSTLALAGGGATNVLAGGELSVDSTLSIAGISGGHTVLVDGIGSSLGAAALNTGLNGQAGSLTFSNGSAGTFAAIGVDSSNAAGTTGTLSIQSGADVTGTALNLASNTVANTGTITIDGAGSSLTVTGAGATIIGAASASSGTLTVQSGGAFLTGTGNTTIHATGAVHLTGGGLAVNGNLTVDGGSLTANVTSAFNVAPDRTVTFQNGGDGNFSSLFVEDYAVSVTGVGSALSGSGAIETYAEPGDTSTISVTAGGSMTAGVLSLMGGAVTVSGAGSQHTSTSETVLGRDTGAGNIPSQFTISDSAMAALGSVQVGDDAPGVLATLTISSGADATGLSMIIGSEQDGDGSVIVTGSGSTLTLSEACAIAVGGSGSGALAVESGAVFTAAQGGGIGSLGSVTLGGGGRAAFTTGLQHEGALSFPSSAILGGTSVSYVNGVTQTGGATAVSAGAIATFRVPYARGGGTFDVAAGGTARFGAVLTGTGGFTGAGTVELTDFSGYNPGPAPAAVSFGGNLIAEGQLTVQIAGTTPGTQHDQLTVAGTVTLPGFGPTILMEFTGNFAPTAGQTFDLIDGATLTGSAFGGVISGLLPGWEFTVDEIPAQGIVRVNSLSDATTSTGPTVREWDGTGADHNLATAANWIGDTAPASALASTVLIFADNTLRPAPQLAAPLSVRAVYFPFGAGAFTFGGQPLSVGAYGIYGEGGPQLFHCPVDFSGVAASRITAEGSTLTFQGNVTLPTGTLTLDGTSGSIFLGNLLGTGTVVAQAPDVVLAPTAGVQQYDLQVTFGTVTTEPDGSPDVFGSSASLTFDGGHLALGADLTLEGAAFTVQNGTGVSVVAPAVWRIHAGSDVDLRASLLDLQSDTSFIVSGAGSTLQLPLESHQFISVQALAGGTIAMPLSRLECTDLVVDGAGSSLVAGQAFIDDFTSDPAVDATFSGGATATFTSLDNTEQMRIASGATVTTGALFHGTGSAELEITGTGSALHITGPDPTFLGREVFVRQGGALAVADGELVWQSELTLESGSTADLGPEITPHSSAALTASGGTNHFHGTVLGAGGVTTTGAGTTLVLHDAFAAFEFIPEDGTTLRLLGEALFPSATQFGDFGAPAGLLEFHGGLDYRSLFGNAEGEFRCRVLFAPANTLSLGLRNAFQYDFIRCFGAAPASVTFGGKLRVTLQSGFVPALGDEFEIFQFFGPSAGTFASFDLPVLPAGRGWDLSDLYTDGLLRVVAIAGFDQWRVDRFGTAAYDPAAADLADPEGDGTANLLEYAFGLDPLAPSTAGLPTVGTVTAGPDTFLTLTFTRPLSATDLRYEVEVGSSPAAFVAGSRYGVGGDLPNTGVTTQVSRTPAGPNETIVVRDNTPMSATAQRLIRVRVTRP